MPNIIFKNKSFIVVNKPVCVPSQPDPSGDKDLMSETSEYLKEIGESDALWLVHRLDRVVGGLMVFARTKDAAAKLSALCSGGLFKKEYLAVIEGEVGQGVFSDLLFKDSAKGRSYVVDRMRGGVKEGKLKYESLSCVNTDKGDRSLVKIDLITGRFHQIRCQFSHRGMPLVGDGKYGSRDAHTRTPALFAVGLSFTLGDKNYTFKALPEIDKYPWSLFEKESYRD